MQLDGKTALVTGSIDGVGRYVAKRLGGAGAKVLIHGRDAARAKALAEEIERAKRLVFRCRSRPNILHAIQPKPAFAWK